MELPRSAQLLRAVGVEAEELALAGGGVWAFGSRAAGCAVATSDWDFLVVEPRREEPAHERHAELDLVYVGRADFLRGWRTSELAGHVSRWGVRLAAHDDLVLRALPGEAAPRKCRVVRNRARQLASFWTAFQAGQQAREATRLRRDLP